jgi:hypothetical protein
MTAELEKLREALAGCNDFAKSVDIASSDLLGKFVSQLIECVDHRGEEGYEEATSLAFAAFHGHRSRDAEVLALEMDKAQLQAEKDDLERWKTEAIQVEMSWDIQAVGDALGMRIGTFIRPKILPAIQALQAEKAELVEALRTTYSYTDGIDDEVEALLAKHGKEN